MSRLETLEQLLSQNPSDTFVRYGLAMEYSRAGRPADALAQYEAILESEPDYAAAWYQGGQLLEQLGRIDEAREHYRRGVEVTTRLGDHHARDQVQAALDQLG